MAHFKTLLLFFFFAGILISGSTAGRPIHIAKTTELEFDHEASPALAPDSHSLVPAESPVGSEHGESGEQTVQVEKNHHSSDKSVAGGGVIIGGLITVTFAAVYCYIRVTRKRDG